MNMKIAPTTFLAALFSGQVAVNTVMQRALSDVAGDSRSDADTEVNWPAFVARTFDILDAGDADAEAARKAAASGEFALADLLPPASIQDRAQLNSDVVAGLKAIGRTLGVSII